MQVLIVGDGPGGLSAALFLAKKGHDVTVIGKNETAMHWAHLYNYLGIPSIGGTAFQEQARAQAASHGATLVDGTVTALAPGFEATLEDGTTYRGDYVILSEGKKPALALALGCEAEGNQITVDREGRTSVDRVYAIGRSTRPGKSQAIISPGDGAVAALDILAREAGKRVVDWDTPEKAD